MNVHDYINIHPVNNLANQKNNLIDKSDNKKQKIIIRNPKNVILLKYVKYDKNVNYIDYYTKFRREVIRNLQEDEIISPTFDDVILMWCLERIDLRLPDLIYKTLGIRLFKAAHLCSLKDTIFQLIPKLLNQNVIIVEKQVSEQTIDPLAVFIPKSEETSEIKDEPDEIKLDLEDITHQLDDITPTIIENENTNIEIGNSWSCIKQNQGQVSQLEKDSPPWKVKLPDKVPFKETPKMVRNPLSINQGSLRTIPNITLKPIRIAPNETPKFIRIAPKIIPNLNKDTSKNAFHVPEVEKLKKVEPNQSEIATIEKLEQKKITPEEIRVRPLKWVKFRKVDCNPIENKCETDVPINISSSQNKEPINPVPIVDKNNTGPKNIEMFSFYEPNVSEDMSKMTVKKNEEPLSKAPNTEQVTKSKQSKISLKLLKMTSKQFDQLSKIFPYKFKSIDNVPEERKTQMILSPEEFKKLRLILKIFPVRYKNLMDIIGPNDYFKVLELPKAEKKKALPKPQKKEALSKPEKKKALPKPKIKKALPKIIEGAATGDSPIKDGLSLCSIKQWNQQVLCPLCRKKIKLVNLENHIRDLHMKHEAICMTGIWKCNWCQEECSSKYDLQTHIHLFHNGVIEEADIPKGLSCPDCLQDFFYSHTSLRVHRFYNHSMENGTMRYFCYRCETQYDSSKQLVQHMEEFNHEDDQEVTTKYYCTLCNTPSGFMSSIADLRAHLVCVHRQEKEEDEIQTAVASAPVFKLMEESEKKFCEVCGKGFVTEQHLSIHSRSHKIKQHKMINQQEEQGHLCPDCGKVFNTKQNLVKHMRVHKDKDVHIQCPHCHKQYSSTHILNHHLRQSRKCNPNKKKLSCELCMKQFEHPRFYTRHKLTHEGVKFEECDLCEGLFTSRKQLTWHKREVHVRPGQDETYAQNKRVECDICKKVLASKFVLRQHKKLHHGDQKGEYKCHICGERRANKYSLSNHILTHKDRGDRQLFECIGGCGKDFQSLRYMYSHYNSEKCGE